MAWVITWVTTWFMTWIMTWMMSQDMSHKFESWPESWHASWHESWHESHERSTIYKVSSDQDSTGGRLAGDEFTRPILRLRHPPNVGFRRSSVSVIDGSMAVSARLTSAARTRHTSVSVSGRAPRPGWPRRGRRRRPRVRWRFAIPRFIGVGLTEYPSEYSPGEDKEKSGEERDETGAEEDVPMAVLEARIERLRRLLQNRQSLLLEIRHIPLFSIVGVKPEQTNMQLVTCMA